MKKPLFYSFILVLGLALPLVSTSAQTVTADPTVEGATATDEQVDLDLKNQPLEVRQQVVSAQLTSILTKLNMLYDKTKAAMDRLTANGIDTSKAQTELALVTDSLTKSKANIDAFASTNISAKTSKQTPLRDAVVKAETTLRESREHIINTLLLLKAAIPTPVNAQQ